MAPPCAERSPLSRYASTRSWLRRSWRARQGALHEISVSFPFPFPSRSKPLFHGRFGHSAPVSKTGMGGFVHRGFESLPLRSTARLGRFLLGVGASGAGAVGQPGPTRDWPTSGSSFPSRSPGGGRDQGRHRPVHPPSAHRCNRATRANLGQRGPACRTFRSLERAAQPLPHRGWLSDKRRRSGVSGWAGGLGCGVMGRMRRQGRFQAPAAAIWWL